MPLFDEPGNGMIDGIGIVDENGIGDNTLNDAVYLHHGNAAVGGQLGVLLCGKILGDIDETVDAGGQQKAEVVALQTVAGTVAGDEAVVAVLTEGLVQGHEQRAEEGRGHIRQQNADGAAALHLETAGKVVHAEIQRGDGFADRVGIFGADIAAVDIFRNRGGGDARHAGNIFDRSHRRSLLPVAPSAKRFAFET